MKWTQKYRKKYMGEYNRKYRNRPEVKARRLKYLNRPDVKARMKAYGRTAKSKENRRKWWLNNKEKKAQYREKFLMARKLKRRLESKLAHPPRDCKYCRQSFIPKQVTSEYCDEWCKTKARFERLKLERKSNIKPRPCMDCGEAFLPKHNYSIPTRCPECRQVKHNIYYTIRELRKRYAMLKYTDPAEAKMISDEMERIEGGDFTELALDGLVKGKPYLKGGRAKR